MRFNHRNRLTAALLAGVAVITAASCSSDRTLTEAQRHITPPGSNATLWDGSQVGGNPNVFFLPPLVSNPNGVAPTYGVNPFQPGLPVQFEIACLTPPSGGSCVGRGLPRTNASVDQSNQQYQLNWDTKAPGFDPGYIFRINVWIGSTNVAFADVVLISNANPKNRNTSDDIPLPDGRTMPIKVHVQTGWACKNQTSCVTQVVGNTPPTGQNFTQVITNDGEDLAAFPPNWFDPSAVGTNQVLVTIEDVTPNFTTGCSYLGGSTKLTSMLSRNHCVRVTTDPEVQHVTNNVLIATCVDNPGDIRQLVMKYDVNEEPIFLRNVNVSAQTGFICPENHVGMSRSPNRLVRFASNTLTRVGGALKTLFGPKTAYAIDQGVGGSLDLGGGFSVFNLGLDATMSIASGNNQSGTVGSTLAAPMVVSVSTLHTNSSTPGSAIVGQKLTCTVTAGGGSFLVGDANVTSAAATDNNDGTYSCPNLTLGNATGTNSVLVTSASVDPTVQIEVLPAPDDQSVSCNLEIEGSGAGLPNDCRQYPGTVTFTATATGQVIGLLRQSNSVWQLASLGAAQPLRVADRRVGAM